jgi:hypothetical protein
MVTCRTPQLAALFWEVEEPTHSPVFTRKQFGFSNYYSTLARKNQFQFSHALSVHHKSTYIPISRRLLKTVT